MKLFTKAIHAKLLKQGGYNHAKGCSMEHRPVVKLFTPDGAATWLLSEIDPHNPDLAFGLCDLGMGEPELGYVSISELQSIRGGFGLPIERDRWWSPTMTLSEYADAARAVGGIQ